VQLPDVGDDLEAGAAIGELESTKSVSDLYAPLSGSVVSRNETLDQTPELVNSDPYGEGWLLEIRPSDPAAVDALMSAEDYRVQVEES
jgi:glycine cleavage system H protein